jgi:FAD/FMN-containing dehydrogenase
VPDKLEPYVSQLHAALDGELEGYLRTDNASRAMWSTDASIYLRKPVGVVVARSEEDVRRALSAALGLGLSITPRGTGTSLAGQATAPGLALDVSEMRRALEIDLEGRRSGNRFAQRSRALKPSLGSAGS